MSHLKSLDQPLCRVELGKLGVPTFEALGVGREAGEAGGG